MQALNAAVNPWIPCTLIFLSRASRHAPGAASQIGLILPRGGNCVVFPAAVPSDHPRCGLNAARLAMLCCPPKAREILHIAPFIAAFQCRTGGMRRSASDRVAARRPLGLKRAHRLV